jgi:hypothetical protein
MTRRRMPVTGLVRLVVTQVLWLPMLVLWRWLMAWQAAALNAAHARGVMVEPGDLIVSLPIWFLIVAWYTAGPIARRLAGATRDHD